MGADSQFLSPAEVALRAGVSVRALRLYERKGLLTPVRTSTGWRTYGPAQLTRLYEILALKGLGLSLAGIAKLLAGQPSDLGRALGVQARALAEQRRRTEAMQRAVAAAQARFAGGAAPTLSDLIDLVKETTLTEQPAHMEAYIAELSKTMSADEIARLSVRDGWERSRMQLIEELKALTARTEPPLSAASLDFMRRWAQFHALGIGGDETLGERARVAWQTMMRDPQAARDAPYGAAERGYITAVGEAVVGEQRRLYARAEVLAEAGADPASTEALALVARLREMTGVYVGLWPKSKRDARRSALLASGAPAAGATVSDRATAFLERAGEAWERWATAA
jgi:DNA-binding transcriptional MerR regulator